MGIVRLIIQKEALQVFRDKRMLFLIFVPPVVQLLILAQAMTFEVKHTDFVLVDADRSQAARSLVEAFTASGRFNVVQRTISGEVADEALLTRSGLEKPLQMQNCPICSNNLNTQVQSSA